MTAQAMNCVWEMLLPSDQKLAMLALADCYGDSEFTIDIATDLFVVKIGWDFYLSRTVVLMLLSFGLLEMVAEDFEDFESSHIKLVLPNPNDLPNHMRVVQRVEELKTTISKHEDNENGQYRPGYVYVLKSISGYYKIGRTKDPNDRLATFEVKLPFEVEFEHLIRAGDMYALEAELHQHFSDKRVNGEWFDLQSSDIEYIKSLGEKP